MSSSSDRSSSSTTTTSGAGVAGATLFSSICTTIACVPTPLPLVSAFINDDAGAELAQTLSVAALLAVDPTKSNKKSKAKSVPSRAQAHTRRSLPIHRSTASTFDDDG